MNGNCPAGFNHVLNWQKNRRKALLRQLRIDRSGSRPIATPLSPHHTGTHSLLHPHAHTNMCTPMSEQVTEVLITVMARWKRGQKMRGGMRTGEKWRCQERGTHGGRQAPILASDCQLWQQTERKIIVSSRV